MNQVGIYFAYWTREWEANYPYFIEKAAKLGFDILEVCTASLVGLPKEKLLELRRTARDSGVKLTFCLGTAPEYDMSSPLAAVRTAGVEYAKRTLEMIYNMGGTVYGGINYACWPVQTLPCGLSEKQEYWKRSVESLRKVLPTAEAYGIQYCFEIVNRFEQFLLNTAEEGVRFCKEVESKNAKVLLDTYHMNIEEDSFGGAIETAGSYLGHFHIGETNRKTPGTGKMPWHEIMAALHRIGYQGAVVMEPFVVPGGQVGKDIRVWRDLSNGADEAALDELARKAAAFVKAALASTGAV